MIIFKNLCKAIDIFGVEHIDEHNLITFKPILLTYCVIKTKLKFQLWREPARLGLITTPSPLFTVNFHYTQKSPPTNFVKYSANIS